MSSGKLLNSNDYEVQLTNFFEVFFGFPEPKDDILGLALESVSPLQKVYDPVREVHFVPNLTFSFKDFVGKDTSGLLREWLKPFELDPQLRTNIHLIQYSHDGDSFRAWKLSGCFPVLLSLGLNDVGGAAKSALTLEISLKDFFRVEKEEIPGFLERMLP